MTEKRDKFGRRIYLFRLGTKGFLKCLIILQTLLLHIRKMGSRQGEARGFLRLCLRAAGAGGQGGEDPGGGAHRHQRCDGPGLATPQVPRARADEGHRRLHERGLPHLGEADTHCESAPVRVECNLFPVRKNQQICDNFQDLWNPLQYGEASLG